MVIEILTSIKNVEIIKEGIARNCEFLLKKTTSIERKLKMVIQSTFHFPNDQGIRLRLSLKRRLKIPEHPIYYWKKERTRSSKRDQPASDQVSERERERGRGRDDVSLCQNKRKILVQRKLQYPTLIIRSRSIGREIVLIN